MHESEIPAGGGVIATQSDSGDDCHREIINVSTTRMKKSFYDKRHYYLFHICDPKVGIRVLEEADLAL
jgi:hypothetical protein